MSDTMKIRREQIQSNTITTDNIDKIDISKIYNNDINLDKQLTKYINITLNKNNWSNNQYIINNNLIKENSNGILLNNNQNEEQLYELIKCNIKIISQNNNILILSCDSRPQMDLNLLILLKQGED